MSVHSFNAQSADLGFAYRGNLVRIISDNKSWDVRMYGEQSLFEAVREWFPSSRPSFSVHCRPEAFSALPDDTFLNILSFLGSSPCVYIREELVYEPDSQDEEYEYGCCTYHSEVVPAPANIRNPLCLGQAFTHENGDFSATSTHFLSEPREKYGLRYMRAIDDTITTLKEYSERLTEHDEPLTWVIEFHPECQGVEVIDEDECYGVLKSLQAQNTKEKDEEWANSYEWWD